jgi:hypothetical protein
MSESLNARQKTQLLLEVFQRKMMMRW